jgi:hypothetical protein
MFVPDGTRHATRVRLDGAVITLSVPPRLSGARQNRKMRAKYNLNVVKIGIAPVSPQVGHDLATFAPHPHL